MAMLTFLRIGKEIHDETEAYLIGHLLERQQTYLQRIFSNIRAGINRIITWVLQLFGLDGFI